MALDKRLRPLDSKPVMRIMARAMNVKGGFHEEFEKCFKGRYPSLLVTEHHPRHLRDRPQNVRVRAGR